MSDRFFRLAGALREAPAAAPGAVPSAARRTRAGLTARTAVPRSIRQCLSVLALMALAAAGVSGGSALAATRTIAGTNAQRQATMAHAPQPGTGPGPTSAAVPRIAKTRAQWKANIARLRQPRTGAGCYRAAFPVLRWHAARCVKAPRVPLAPKPLQRPRPARHAGPDTIGGGSSDYSAQSPGKIYQATGTFTDVSPGIYEQGLADGSGSPAANAFSLQLNTQFFAGSPACDGSSDPSNCQAWQQFVYDYGNSVTSLVYMQYWLLNYDATCPAGWTSYNSECYLSSNAAEVDTLTASQRARSRRVLEHHPVGRVRRR